MMKINSDEKKLPEHLHELSNGGIIDLSHIVCVTSDIVYAPSAVRFASELYSDIRLAYCKYMRSKHSTKLYVTKNHECIIDLSKIFMIVHNNFIYFSGQEVFIKVSSDVSVEILKAWKQYSMGSLS